MPETPATRIARLVRHARAGWRRARADASVCERALAWLAAHPSKLPEVDELWRTALTAGGPLADWLERDEPPESWLHELPLHSVLARHPFPDLPQWSPRTTSSGS